MCIFILSLNPTQHPANDRRIVRPPSTIDLRLEPTHITTIQANNNIPAFFFWVSELSVPHGAPAFFFGAHESRAIAHSFEGAVRVYVPQLQSPDQRPLGHKPEPHPSLLPHEIPPANNHPPHGKTLGPVPELQDIRTQEAHRPNLSLKLLCHQTRPHQGGDRPGADQRRERSRWVYQGHVGWDHSWVYWFVREGFGCVLVCPK